MCHIHTYAERKNPAGQWELIAEAEPFAAQSYALFGWLADVRNYAAVPCITRCRDVPSDVSAGVRDEYREWDKDLHSASWLSLAELQSFDYDKPLKCAASELRTYREFLGARFFEDLCMLEQLRAERIVFWFDN